MQIDKSQLNVSLFNQVIADIQADDGETFLMNEFLIDGKQFIQTGCGAPGCLAGWALMAAFKDATIEDREALVPKNWVTVAADLIGIPPSSRIDSSDAVNALFYMRGSRMAMKEFDEELSATQRKRAAIEVLTHLRDTGFIDWDRALTMTLEC